MFSFISMISDFCLLFNFPLSVSLMVCQFCWVFFFFKQFWLCWSFSLFFYYLLNISFISALICIVSFYLLILGFVTLLFSFSFYYLYLSVLGFWCSTWALCCCSRDFSSYGEWGLLSSCSMQASPCSGFSSCGGQAFGYTGFSICCTWTHWLQLMGSVARDQICIPYIGRWVLNPWTTKKVPSFTSLRCKVRSLTWDLSSF